MLYFRFIALMVISSLFLFGCGSDNQESQIEFSSIVNSDDSVCDISIVESDTNDTCKDVFWDNNKVIDDNTENLVFEYAKYESAIAYYQDFYLSGKYLIIESDGVTSYLSLDGYSSIEKIKYDDVVHVNINYIDNLGFIEITDKAGGSLSFVFESSEAKEVDQLIDNYR